MMMAPILPTGVTRGSSQQSRNRDSEIKKTELLRNRKKVGNLHERKNLGLDAWGNEKLIKKETTLHLQDSLGHCRESIFQINRKGGLVIKPNNSTIVDDSNCQ
jgi:hypothetical protein